MGIRTDLAIESTKIEGGIPQKGVEIDQYRGGELSFTAVEVKTREAAQAIGKPVGRYITAELSSPSDLAEARTGEAAAIAGELRRLLPQEGTVLVVGLGNREITPDALGPLVISDVLATRHFEGRLMEESGLSSLRPVASLAPGVLGQTGMETGEIIRSVVGEIEPAAVIAIDALAARSLSRLGCTIQLADCGIAPGSGVANRRKELSQETLGVPVISMGIPTVVDGETLAFDLLYRPEGASEESMEQLRQMFQPQGRSMMVTPREVDQMVERGAKLISMAINLALQPDLSAEEITYLLA